MAAGSETVDTDLSRPSLATLTFLKVCLLTSLTLLFIGSFGHIRGIGNTKEPRLRSTQRTWSTGTAKRLSSRVLSVGLPIYACSRIGGLRVAILVLVATASGLMSVRPKIEDLNRPATFKKVLWPRKWTILLLCTQYLLDLIGWTSNGDPWQLVVGYLALSLSVFILPPPYPTTIPKASVVTSPVSKQIHKLHRLGSPLDMAPETDPQVRLGTASSPLVLTPWDTELTIVSGLVAAVAAIFVFFVFSADSGTFDAASAYGIVIVSLLGASGLLLSNPRALRQFAHVALAVGLLCTIFFPQVAKPQGAAVFGTQAALAFLFWLAAGLDSQASGRPAASRHTSASYASGAHKHPHERHSRLTSVMLRLFQDWPLFHSILVEKDSRRIFYFMM